MQISTWIRVAFAIVVAGALGLAKVPGGTTALAAAEAGGDGYYTKAQAVRGKTLYNRECRLCHTDLAGRTQMELGPGFVQRVIEGTRAYPSVYYLFAKVRESMPGWGADRVSNEAKADIIAYLLEVSGYPAGPRELKPDVTAMKGMWLNERGFESLFNGRDFTGLRFLFGPRCRPHPDGCGSTEPTTFSIRDNELVTTGKIQGYIYTEKKYLNFTLRADQRFVLPADWDGEKDNVVFWGDTGYMLFVNEHRVWPKALQFQGDYRHFLTITPMSTKATFTEDVDARKRARRPPGEWNSVEIVSKNGEIRGFLNGVLISTVTQHEFREPGAIAIQSEGAEVRWRNIRIRPE
jgi:mono/diheme cytochrome c family protein